MQIQSSGIRPNRSLFQRLSKLFGTVLISGVCYNPHPVWAGYPSASFPPPTPYVVPQITRLEINLSQRQLTLYHGTMRIRSYPVAVGRDGWSTPTGSFQVMQMIQDPAWMNPFTRNVIPGGDPDNPLGRYWIGFWTDGNNWVGMHGTPNPESVGRAASHGCIRLYNRDIEEVFALVTVGLPVIVVP